MAVDRDSLRSRFTENGFDTAQATALVDSLAEVSDVTLTKEHLNLELARVNVEIREFKVEIREEIVDVKQKLGNDIDKLRNDIDKLRNDVDNLRKMMIRWIVGAIGGSGTVISMVVIALVKFLEL